MSNQPADKKFKKWLDILQQESWQLELIISGFAIYGLIMVIDPIELAAQQAENDNHHHDFQKGKPLLCARYFLEFLHYGLLKLGQIIQLQNG